MNWNINFISNQNWWIGLILNWDKWFLIYDYNWSWNIFKEIYIFFWNCMSWNIWIVSEIKNFNIFLLSRLNCSWRIKIFLFYYMNWKIACTINFMIFNWSISDWFISYTINFYLWSCSIMENIFNNFCYFGSWYNRLE